MSQSRDHHVLDFFQDDEGGAALTVLARDTRFHIIADEDRLKACGKAGKSVLEDYRRLFAKAQSASEGDGNKGQNAGKEEVEAGSGKSTPSDGTHDSGIDIPATEKDDTSGSARSHERPERALQNWMLDPLADVFKQANRKGTKAEGKTVQDWYHSKTRLFQLDINDGKLAGTEEDCSEDIDARMTALIPDMPLPKYIRDHGIDMVNAQDVVIVAESTEPEPIHPALVEVKGERMFLKVVDMNQLQPTKREIHMMKRMEKKKLHEEFRMPLVRGLVHFDGKAKSTMGFLMDAIEDPTPLTQKLDTEIPQKQREEWAAEAERIVKLLHENDFIWGDAKADNFMVDANDDLWIIDFGGSYTEGWVDPELKETVEGDDMGVAKIANALRNPEEGTYDPERDQKESSLFMTSRTEHEKKRKSSDEDEEDEDSSSDTDERPAKRAKSD